MSRRKQALELLSDTWVNFQRDGGPLLGGAVAFFAVLSAAPLVMVAVAIAGVVYGEEVARGELRWRVRSAMGQKGGDLVMRFIEASVDSQAGVVATIVGVAVVLFAASRLFVMLRLGLNLIWGVRIKPKRTLKSAAATLARKRLISFGMVVLCGLLLMVVLTFKTGFSAVDNLLGDAVHIGWFWRVLEFFVSMAVLTVLFASMYKVLPDARIAWKDVWIGATLTAALMSIGSLLIGLYLGYVGPASTYGAAGSLVLLLLWVYYSGQIFFMGASFTEVWAHRYGGGVTPEPHAERMVLAPREDSVPPWIHSSGE